MTYWKLGNQTPKDTLALRLMCGPSMMEQPGTCRGEFPVGSLLVPAKKDQISGIPCPTQGQFRTVNTTKFGIVFEN